ncbi:MAG: type 2 isopentenyl-diphosphate Delta-isomerase [Thermoplasmata archaeon]|nr:type 2 isopentenyl-diphosphate Delta-isomerase [Thermoplasmata archaeon]
MNNAEMTEKRKSDHVEICSTKDVSSRWNFWDDIHLVHTATPELDFDRISTELRIFGKTLAFPIVIAGMTGGYQSGERINMNLAKAASDNQIGMGVGSQRAALENPALARTFAVLKEYDIPLKIANIGAPQLVEAGNYRKASDMLNDAMEMIDADLIAIHLNYLQEAVQPEGEKNAKGVMAMVRDLATDFPLLVKETGAGLSLALIKTLSKMKIKGVDVGGLSGTSFSAVEFYRAQEVGDHLRARLGRTFWNWGIPTPVSAAVASLYFPTIATGGIRSGLDVAKAIAIGATCAGIANRMLLPALESADATESELKSIIEELMVSMFLTGSENVKSLSNHSPLVLSPTKDWLEHIMGEGI